MLPLGCEQRPTISCSRGTGKRKGLYIDARACLHCRTRARCIKAADRHVHRCCATPDAADLLSRAVLLPVATHVALCFPPGLQERGNFSYRPHHSRCRRLPRGDQGRWNTASSPSLHRAQTEPTLPNMPFSGSIIEISIRITTSGDFCDSRFYIRATGVGSAE